MSMVRGLATMVMLIAAAGCQSPPAAPYVAAQDSLNSVVDMNPQPGTELHPGQAVTFSGTVGFVLATADVGTMNLAVQDQTRHSLTSNIQAVVVHRGSADVTISQTVTIPADGVTGVSVFFVMLPAGATVTRAGAQLSYPVR
jgi:beta-lactam-binding protein with PASTA domain